MRNIISLIFMALVFTLGSCSEPSEAQEVSQSNDIFDNNPDVPDDAFIRHLGSSVWEAESNVLFVHFTQDATQQKIKYENNVTIKSVTFDYRILDEKTLVKSDADYPRLVFSDKDHFVYQEKHGEPGTSFSSI